MCAKQTACCTPVQDGKDNHTPTGLGTEAIPLDQVVVSQRSDEQTARSTAPDGADDGKRLGLALSPIPEAARGQLGLEPGTSGVLIQRVDPNGPAAEAGLRQGDVIVSANNQLARAPADVAKAWTDAQGQKRPVLLRVKREDQYLFVAIEG